MFTAAVCASAEVPISPAQPVVFHHLPDHLRSSQKTLPSATFLKRGAEGCRCQTEKCQGLSRSVLTPNGHHTCARQSFQISLTSVTMPPSQPRPTQKIPSKVSEAHVVPSLPADPNTQHDQECAMSLPHASPGSTDTPGSMTRTISWIALDGPTLPWSSLRKGVDATLHWTRFPSRNTIAFTRASAVGNDEPA